jgi:hypothetical protein
MAHITERLLESELGYSPISFDDIVWLREVLEPLGWLVLMEGADADEENNTVTYYYKIEVEK